MRRPQAEQTQAEVSSTWHQFPGSAPTPTLLPPDPNSSPRVPGMSVWPRQERDRWPLPCLVSDSECGYDLASCPLLIHHQKYQVDPKAAQRGKMQNPEFPTNTVAPHTYQSQPPDKQRIELSPISHPQYSLLGSKCAHTRPHRGPEHTHLPGLF